MVYVYTYSRERDDRDAANLRIIYRIAINARDFTDPVVTVIAQRREGEAREVEGQNVDLPLVMNEAVSRFEYLRFRIEGHSAAAHAECVRVICRGRVRARALTSPAAR